MTAYRPIRTAAGTLVASLVVAALAGCGIRATSVPVDAGPAPSRVSCALEEAGQVPSQDVSGTSARVHLVCSSSVVAVTRSVEQLDREAGNRLEAARALLEELQKQPSSDEKKAGFSSAVPGHLRVDGREDDDPESALRLSTEPSDLPSFALAQIVCTYAESPAAERRGSVVLGGPAGAGSKPLLRYTCGNALRSSPEAAETAGAPL